MNPPLWFNNLAADCSQIAVLAIIGALLPRVFRLRVPKISVVYWQVLLTACLVLPILQPWQRVTFSPQVSFRTVSFETGPLVAAPVHAAFPTFPAIAVALMTGVVIRLLWIALGLYRLRQYRRRARSLSPVPDSLKDLRSAVGVGPELLLSDEVEGPATWGMVVPVVLLPARFTTMDAACQRAIACHEFVHVRRRDWLFNLAEEVILAMFWFHPAIWWVIRQIRLTREQTVDREVLQLTEARRPYLEALLDLASRCAAPRPVPAPLFLEESQLTERVALMLKEVSMSKSRLVLSLAAISALLLATTVVAVRAFPLKARPIELAQSDSQADKASTKTQPAEKVETKKHQAEATTPDEQPPGLKVIRRVSPEYPRMAKFARIEGIVALDVTVEKNGEVSNIVLVSGHPLLAQAAMEAVRQWRFEPPPNPPAVTTVRVDFALPKETSDEEKLAEAKAMLDQRQAEEQARYEQEALAEAAEEEKLSETKAMYEKRQDEEQARLQQKLAEVQRQLEQAQAAGQTRSADEQRQALAQLMAEQDALKKQMQATTYLALQLAEKQRNEALARLKADQEKLAESSASDRERLQEQTLLNLKAQKAKIDAEIAGLEQAIRDSKSRTQSESELKPVKTENPVYPEQAKRDHIQGNVVLKVTVDQDGSVSGVEVLSGPPALVKAATDAVRQWRFSKPLSAPATTTVIVYFTLS